MTTRRFEIKDYCPAVAEKNPNFTLLWDPQTDMSSVSKECSLPQTIGEQVRRVTLSTGNIDRMVVRKYQVTLHCGGCPLFRRWKGYKTIAE